MTSLSWRRVQPRPGAEDPDFHHRFREERPRRWLRGARNGLSVRSLIGYRLGVRQTVTLDGQAVLFSPHQATYRLVEDLWMRGEYDFPGFVPEAGWRVIDIGANVGIYSLLAASRGASVTAYEPDPDAFERLEANAAGRPIVCHRAAVTAETGSRLLYQHPLRDTRHTLLGDTGGVVNSRQGRGSAGEYDHSVEVPTLAARKVLERGCDLLKVACEGGEFEIFQAAGDALSGVRRVVLELHTDLQTPHGDASSLASDLRARGFEVRLRPTHPAMSRVFLTATRAG